MAETAKNIAANTDTEGQSRERQPWENAFNEAGELEKKGPYGAAKNKVQEMLQAKLAGKPEDTTKFEGYLRFIVECGKAFPIEIFYYIAAGNHAGLISKDTIGNLNSKYLNMFPWLEYFMDKDIPEAKMKEFCKNLAEKNKSGPETHAAEFFTEEVMTNEKVRARTNKAMRNKDAIDSDFTSGVIPMLNEESVKTALSPRSGTNLPFTTQGYINAYAGFGPLMKSSAKKENKDALLQSIKSFVLYDAILDSRYEIQDSTYARLSAEDRRKTPVEDNHQIDDHQKQLQALILEIGHEYGINFSEIFEKVKNPNTDAGIQRQAEIQVAIRHFGEQLDAAIAKDPKGPQKMFEVVRKTNLHGMSKYKESSVEKGKKETRKEVQHAMAA